MSSISTAQIPYAYAYYLPEHVLVFPRLKRLTMPGESPSRLLTDTRRTVNEPSFLVETKKTWEELESKPMTDQDATDISTNMSAFFNLLIEWDVATQSSVIEGKKKSRTRTTRVSPPTGPATL